MAPEAERPGSREPADPGDPSEPDGSPAPAHPFPGDSPRDDLDAYVGMPRQEAESRAAARGWRPVRSLPPDAVVTMEYVAGRLNFTIDADHVTRCWMG